MWIKQHKSLGRVQQKTTHQVLFQYDGPVPEEFKVERVEASCGCTKPNFNRLNGTLVASFTAPKVPQHLLWKGEYKTTKKVILHSNVGSFTFTFSVTVHV